MTAAAVLTTFQKSLITAVALMAYLLLGRPDFRFWWSWATRNWRSAFRMMPLLGFACVLVIGVGVLIILVEKAVGIEADSIWGALILIAEAVATTVAFVVVTAGHHGHGPIAIMSGTASSIWTRLDLIARNVIRDTLAECLKHEDARRVALGAILVGDCSGNDRASKQGLVDADHLASHWPPDSTLVLEDLVSQVVLKRMTRSDTTCG